MQIAAQRQVQADAIGQPRLLHGQQAALGVEPPLLGLEQHEDLGEPAAVLLASELVAIARALRGGLQALLLARQMPLGEQRGLDFLEGPQGHVGILGGALRDERLGRRHFRAQTPPT